MKIRFLPRSLMGRSLLILITPLILVQAITAFMFFDRHWEKMTSRLGYAVAGEVAVIAAAYRSDPESFARLKNDAAVHLGLLTSYIEGAHPVVPEGPQRWRQRFIGQALTQQLQGKIVHPFSIYVDNDEKWVRVDVAVDEGGVLRFSLPQRRLFSSSGYIVLLWMCGSSIILLAIAILFMRNQIRPIRRLAVVAERFGRGMDAPGSLKPEGAREVRQATRAFIDMQERIRRQVSQRTLMLAGISHDLRTPLTRMKLELALLPAGSDTRAIQADIEEMERMINAYLDFAKGEEGETPVRTDIGALIGRVIESARREGKTIACDLPGDLYLPLRTLAMERCFANLIGNAAKYADQVWVTAERTEDEEGAALMITIDDDGPGIPPALRADMFRPFVRGEPSRNRETGGVGLGLPIAQDIVHAHGGDIALADSPRGGLRVRVRLPL